jgi:enoyl-CoA hydratase/carnithine racemase
MTDEVLVEPGRVATVRLNRPARRNALSSTALDALVGALEALGQDDGVRVVRLTAAGTRAFCAGADLEEVAGLTDVGAVRRYFGRMARVLAALARCPKPVVAVVFGYTLAGGMGLAAAADLLVAADDTVFGLPEVAVGLYPMVVTAPIARVLGRRRTLDLAWSGRFVDVETAERWGFVNQVVPAAGREQAGLDYCQALAGRSGLIAGLGKTGAGPAEDLDYESALRWLEEQVAVVALSPDSREGIAAFRQPRAPRGTD